MRIILFILILSSTLSCNWLTQAVSPIDFVYSPNQVIDTGGLVAPDSLLIQVVPLADTCFQLVDIDTPSFVVLSTLFFNGMNVNPVWHIGQNQSTDLLALLKQVYGNQYSYAYYEENGAVAVVIKGTSDQLQFQGKVWTTDMIGQVQLLTAFSQAFYFWGALTFVEAMFYAENYPSVRSFHYRNTDWTVAQNNTYARTILHPELCKEGEHIARFTEANGIINTVVDSFTLFDWEFVIDFSDDQLIKA